MTGAGIWVNGICHTTDGGEGREIAARLRWDFQHSQIRRTLPDYDAARVG
jgi:hypothetical protein